jgi:hypothetical protein
MSKISQVVSGAYFIYGGTFHLLLILLAQYSSTLETAPFEIIVAGIFLYQCVGLYFFYPSMDFLTILPPGLWAYQPLRVSSSWS